MVGEFTGQGIIEIVGPHVRFEAGKGVFFETSRVALAGKQGKTAFG